MNYPGKTIFFLSLYWVAILITIPRDHLANENGVIRGQVVHAVTDQPVVDAIIKLKPFEHVIFSNKEGQFIIPNIPAGDYALEVSKPGFAVVTQTHVQVVAGDTTVVTLSLLPGMGESEQVFSIGSIEVTSDKPIISNQSTTTFEIRSGEIEHMQATNLGDALQLAPGVLKSSKIGLDGKVTTAVRGPNTSIETFGTQIMIEGVPISNNASMASVALGSTVQTSAAEGIDLRMLAADNIESIEIIQGIPSAQYGDLTSGIINVKMKSQHRQPKLKMKYSRSTKELSFDQGIARGGHTYSIFMDYAYSERDLRKTGDEWVRLGATLKFQGRWLEDRLKFDYTLMGNKMLDDEKPTDYQQQKKYNHGWFANQTILAIWQPDKRFKAEFRAYLNFRREDRYASKLVQGDPTSYIGEIWDKGELYNPGAQLNLKYRRRQGRWLHELSSGFDFRYDVNRGQGVIIDPQQNYYGQYSADRSFSYNWFPGTNQLALYLEDEITAKLGLVFTLNLGIRYDMFDMVTPFSNARQGDYVSPRLSFLLRLWRGAKVRFGYGRTAKAPSFDMIYQPRDYDVLVDTITDELIGYSLEKSNPALQGYYETKYDFGYEQIFRSWASMRVSFYYSERKKTPSTRSYPVDYYEKGMIEYPQETFSFYQNIGEAEKKGIEFILKTQSWSGIRLQIGSDWSYNEISAAGLNYYSSPDLSLDEPWWHPGNRPANQQLLFKYNLSYVSRQLGAWLSLSAQHLAWKKSVYNDPYTLEAWKNEWFTADGYWLWDVTLSKSIIRSFEYSLYIRNLLNTDGSYYHEYEKSYFTRESGINFGFEISGYLSDLGRWR